MNNTLEIKVNGKAIRHYNHAGNTYVEGKIGTEYSISVKNNNWKRRLFVISVDGINVISGKKAAEDSTTGYVINGYDSLNLKGFRINDQDVAAFKFVKSDQSYAKDITGSSENSGVIGVKIYDEKISLPTVTSTSISTQDWYEWQNSHQYKNTTGNSTHQTTWITCDCNISDEVRSSYTSNAANYCSVTNDVSLMSYQAADFNLGTGWGSKQNQAVTEVDFQVGVHVATMLVYYASRSQLQQMGIDLGNKAKIAKQMPSAFGEKKYCPIPKNWKG